MANKWKRERNRSHRLYRRHARRAEGINGADYDVPDAVQAQANYLFDACNWLTGPDDRTTSVIDSSWHITQRNKHAKRFDVRLLGFWNAENAKRIHAKAEEKKAEQAKKAVVPTPDTIRFMPVYLAAHLARGPRIIHI